MKKLTLTFYKKIFWIRNSPLLGGLFALLVLPNIAFADSTSGHSSFFWFNAHTFAGYGNASAPGDRSTPSLGTMMFGSEIGFRIAGKYLIGASADYRFITQFSDYDPLVGNRRGSATTIASPVLGIEFGRMSIKGMLHLSGNYKIQNTTQTGQALSYAKASGYRVELALPWGSWLKPTAFYESVKFSEQLLDGVVTANTNALTLTQYGIGIVLGL